MSKTVHATVHHIIKRSSRNTTIFALFLIGAALGVFAFSTFEPLSRYFGQRIQLTPQQVISAASNRSSSYNVEVMGTIMRDTGYQEYMTKDGVKTQIQAYFGLLFVPDVSGAQKALLVRSPFPINENILSYSGSIWAPTHESKDVYNSLWRDEPELRTTLLPQILDTDLVQQKTGAFGNTIFEGVFVLSGFILLAMARRWRDPTRHAIFQRLSRLGDAEAILSQIDREIIKSKTQVVGKLQFTPHWLLFISGNETQFMRRADLMWMYKIIDIRVYGKNTTICICDRTGQQIVIQESEKNVDTMAIAVFRYAPWMIVGKQNEIETSWKKDQAGFINTVDHRRAQLNKLKDQ